MPEQSIRLTGRRSDGAPVYGYVRTAGSPPLSLLRFSAADPPGPSAVDHAHAHDFMVLTYFERGEGTVGLDDRRWTIAAGDALVIAPGAVVRIGEHDDGTPAEGWGLFFAPEIIASGLLGGTLGWSAHPLLFPFLGRVARSACRIRVPVSEQPSWSEHVAAIERELSDPRDGSDEAALARLTLLLVSLSRIAVDVGEDLRFHSEPLLAAVFEFIEAHFDQPISLADVAAAVGLTPGHLTTVVRRMTGRTVQQWLTERRMAEARRLLRETDLTVETITARTGYRQPSFFIRQFRRDHGATPAAWRRALRAVRPPSLQI